MDLASVPLQRISSLRPQSTCKRSERGRCNLHLRTIAGSLCFLCILALFAAALTLPLQDAYVSRLSERLAPPNLAHPLGTDELGRDLLSRFIMGTKYTVLAALITTLLAGVSGWFLLLASQTALVWFRRLIAILARICFVAPSFLLASRWPNRLLMTALCFCPILPLFIITFLLITAGSTTGIATSFVLGPLFGVGVAYLFSKADHGSTRTTQADKGRSFRQLAALTAPVFAWSAYFQMTIDILGLGVQPPQPSWGIILDAQSISLWPQAAAGLGFLIIGVTAFTFNDAIASSKT